MKLRTALLAAALLLIPTLVSCGGNTEKQVEPAPEPEITAEEKVNEEQETIIYEPETEEKPEPEAETEEKPEPEAETEEKPEPEAETEEEPETTVKSSFQAGIYIMNEKLWQTPSMYSLTGDNGGFLFEIQDGGENVVNDGLGEAGTPYNSASGQERAARAEEWGYSMTHLDGVTDGMGRKIDTNFTSDVKPETRAEAVERIFAFLDNQYKAKSLSGIFYSMNGHYPWYHYAGENGFHALGTEIGENINNYQLHIAMNRGAARQYGTPWFVDFSMWHGASVRDYKDNATWGEYSGEDNGHSLSLFERSMLMSYMAGANSLVAEAGNIICYYSDGCVTPYGDVCAKLYDFTQTHDVGTCYTPYALILDYYHGMYSGFDGKKAFYYFDYNDGDKFTWNIVSKIWKGGWEIQQGGAEVGTMVNGSLGDTFDMVLQNVPAELLKTYSVAVMTGDTALSAEEVAKFTEYVKNGGILVLNTAYIPQFPELSLPSELQSPEEISVGEGSVIVFGKDWKADDFTDIIKGLSARLIPFTVSEEIEYLVNVKDGALYLTLINNKGVTKEPRNAEKINEARAITIEVNYTGEYNVRSVSDIYNGTEISAANENKTISLTVGAGGIAVLEFILE